MAGFVLVLRDLSGYIIQTIDAKDIGDLTEVMSRVVGEGFTQRHKIEIVSTPERSTSNDTSHSSANTEPDPLSNGGGSSGL